jgi:hypothetical protein
MYSNSSSLSSHIPKSNNNWFHVLCTCKLWNEIGRQVFPPSSKDLLDAVKRNNVLCVKRLLRDSRVDPSFNNNAAIRHSSKSGYLPIVELLLREWILLLETITNLK